MRNLSNASRSPVVIATTAIALNGTSIQYTLKRSRLARHAWLEIRAGIGLIVVIPYRFPLKRVPEIITSKQDWILKHHESLGTPAVRAGYHFGDSIELLGQSLKLVRGAQGEPKAARFAQGPAELVIHLPSDNVLEDFLEGWYRMHARRFLAARVHVLSLQMGLSYGRITIRGQRTRWASCSRKGNLSFNWHLMRLPKPAVDYVIIHELAHLKEMNHGPRFWELVARYCPAWREQRSFLKAHELSSGTV